MLNIRSPQFYKLLNYESSGVTPEINIGSLKSAGKSRTKWDFREANTAYGHTQLQVLLPYFYSLFINCDLFLGKSCAFDFV